MAARTQAGDRGDRVVTFRVPEDLLNGLEQLWARDGISKSESIRRALRMWLDSKGIAAPPKRAAERKRGK
jgi:Arc/MetJ-type ribon-helix-helix transcriptional regulator